MTAHSIQNSSGSAVRPSDRSRASLIVLAVIVGAVVVFALGYLVAHKGRPPAPAARVVNARIAPGPSAVTLKRDFGVRMGTLIKPKPKPKPHTKAAVSSVATYTPPAQTYTPPAESYTPPASSSGTSSSHHSAPKGSGTPSGGGVITIG